MLRRFSKMLFIRRAIYKFTYLSKAKLCCSDTRNVSFTFHKYPSYQVFTGVTDRFNGVTVDTKKLQCLKDNFLENLEKALELWKGENRHCIWFKVHIDDSSYVPILAEKGFNFHHARDDFVMMYKWLPLKTKPNLPPACHTNLGVGALVLNGKNQLLALSEKQYDYPHWKLPGGYVERGEDIVEAAKREVKEETGVETDFTSLITFRHSHNMMFGNSDIYVLLMMKALSENVIVSEREVKDCKWMDIEEYVNHPHVHYFNKFVINQAFKCKKDNIKLDIQKKTVKWAQFTREMNYLSVSNYESE